MLVTVKPAEQEKVFKPGWGLLHSSDTYPKSGLLVGRTMVDLNHKVLPVRVMNMTMGTHKIKKGSDLTKCELVYEIVGENAPPPVDGNRNCWIMSRTCLRGVQEISQ